MNEPVAERPRTHEEEIIASHPPLRTLLWLTVGPLCSQITSSCSGLANTLWVSGSSANPDQVQSVFGLVMTIDFIPTAFGFFLSVCASIKLSGLFAERDTTERAMLLPTCCVWGL